MANTVPQPILAEGRPFDAIAMEIFSNRMLSITENMAIHMMRSSFSTQIKERRDFSVGIFDARGQAPRARHPYPAASRIVARRHGSIAGALPDR